MACQRQILLQDCSKLLSVVILKYPVCLNQAKLLEIVYCYTFHYNFLKKTEKEDNPSY